MPMGIVSDSDFTSELDKLSPAKIKQAEIVDSPARGRGNNVEVPDTLRKVIGDTSVVNGREEALKFAANFGISASSVSAYAHGSKSTASYDEQPNIDSITGARERISKKARNKLLLALGGITKEKLNEASVKVLSGVARDMAAVVKDMEPPAKEPNNPNNGPQFIFYAPQYRKEEHYDVVNAKE